MPYKDGAWGIKAKERSKARNGYFRSYRRTINLMRRYGISENDYKNMFDSQNGCCAVCGTNRPVPSKYKGSPQRLAVDHCHKTGKIRGLLCFSCNRALGYLKDDVSLLKRAVEYLLK